MGHRQYIDTVDTLVTAGYYYTSDNYHITTSRHQNIV